MTLPTRPILDLRDEETFVEVLESRVAGYVPGLVLGDTGPGAALAQIFARFGRVVADRINLAPDKNRLAFYDQLGIELLTAQASRAPIAFSALPNVGDSHVPERSRVGAKVADRSDPLVFETERGIALAAAKLTDVFSLWPGRDAYADHSASATSRTPFTLFTSLTPVRHEWYLGHEVHLALTGQSVIELEFSLTPGSAALLVAWEYWDGKIWRPFKKFVNPISATLDDSVDGTVGFSRAGIVRLVADCAISVKTEVNGVTTHWVRAHLTEPLPPNDSQQLPEIDLVSIRTVIDRQLPSTNCATLETVEAIMADNAFAGETKLDLTKTVQPLGGHPQAGATFAFSCEEIMTRPGAEVTLCFTRVATPEEKADQDAGDFELDVAAATNLVLNSVKQIAEAVITAADAIVDLAAPGDFANLPRLVTLATQRAAVVTESAALTDTDGIQDVAKACRDLVNTMNSVTTGVALPVGSPWDFLLGTLTGLAAGDIFASVDSLTTLNESRIDAAGRDVKDSADDATDALEILEDMTPTSAALAAGAVLPFMPAPQIRWEYWNGRIWKELAVTGSPKTRSFRADGPITFTVPDDIEPVTLNGVTARIVRARLTSGGYGIVRTVSWKDENSGKLNYFPVFLYRPPNIALVKLGYFWRSAPAPPERSFTYNDFQYLDVGTNAATRGDTFSPFAMVADRTPAVYLGFDAPLPADTIGIYADINEVLGETDGPGLTWEFFDGSAWRTLHVEDETHALALPGMLSALWPGVPTGAPQLARFGTPRTWLRARLTYDGIPRQSRINAVTHNCVWAAQQQTFEKETIGSSNGEAGQVFFARQLPVLHGEILEVRELDGERANVEEPILRAELLANGMTEDAIRVVTDARTGKINEVWVRWSPRANLLFAEPVERAYAIERSRGRIVFGGGAHGHVPPAGRDNIRLRRYQAGGGQLGNVAAGAVSQLLSGVLAEKVSNARAAEGGADGESLDRVRKRAPHVVRHRRQAVTAADFEDLAREASPAVAVARALPVTHPSGRFAPGWVTVRIVPHSSDPRPLPSFGLRDRVRQFIAARVPAQIASSVSVIPPAYLAIGVEAEVRPLPFADPALVKEQVEADVAVFLHPLTGGPDGDGWPFGRDVYLSDVARRLEAISGVDAVTSLRLLLDGSPVGDRAVVPTEWLVVAGDLRVSLTIEH